MDIKGSRMLKVLMNKYSPKNADSLLKYLPQEEAQSIQSQGIFSSDIDPILYQPIRLLGRMHYSWLKPHVEKFPARLQPVVLGALTPEQRAGFKTTAAHTLSVPIRNFMLQAIYDGVGANGKLPYEYLPESNFSILGNWSKGQLVNLIDFLGLHDLASEVRHIVNKNHLQNIYNCLTPRQLYYLKVCLHQKETLKVSKLGIHPALQDCALLKKVVHRRGLIRLGKALTGEHPDFIWYLTHTLDSGRGKILMENFQSSCDPKVASLLKGQLLNLINFLKSE